MRSPGGLTGVVAFGLVCLLSGCENATQPPPPVTPTPLATTTGTGAGIRAFAAVPPSIVSGDTFTLTWTASGGLISLARRGESPFAYGLPSSGSHALALGAPGYPTQAGDTVYVVVVGDAALRAETTVHVTAAALPSVTLSGERSCHPTRTARCGVTVTASGSDYDSLVWGGCCAKASGTLAECEVPALREYACTLTATGPGGSVTASHKVDGTNEAPVLKGCTGTVIGTHAVLSCSVVDDDTVYDVNLPDSHTCSADQLSHNYTIDSIDCANPVVLHGTLTGAGPYGIRIHVTDPWSATGSVDVNVGM